MNSTFLKSIIVFGAMVIATPVTSQTKAEKASFKKHILSTNFKSEGVAVLDINKDGKLDIIAGPEWFEAPHWTKHDIYESRNFDPAKEYCTSFLNITLDINFDGWDDLIVVGFPGEAGNWYENPQNKAGLWKKHTFLPEVGIGNESPAFADMDGDGRLDLVFTDSKATQQAWVQAPVNKNDTWHYYPISKPDASHKKFNHGLGVGDLNSDGKKDIFTKAGWWEGPSNPKQSDWTFHAGAIGEDNSQMTPFDINSDGLLDVITSAAHKRGIWWLQQNKDINGNISFAKQEISNLFTQSHASIFTDLNGDGNPDFITGKRFFAHNDTNVDPGTNEPPVLYWFEYKPGKTPSFTPHLIDDNSGAGLQIVVADLNRDKRQDVVIANKKGVFLFEGGMEISKEATR